MSSNSVCNHTRDKQIGLPRFCYHSYDYRPNWTPLSPIIIHQTHYEKSGWSRAFNQFTIACELDMINVISAADNTFIMSSSTSGWLLSPLVLFCFFSFCTEVQGWYANGTLSPVRGISPSLYPPMPWDSQRTATTPGTSCPALFE